ncbi:MAG: pimeloyl-CoA dehydrogenase large subunit [Hyphomicrobiaceae bacterium]|nr:MAG: pimeloyl-CoA dehydrogenase large subunit [Hyphomicrobiaceae bacterium]
MDLRFSAEENAFRDKLRTFFRTKVPASIRDKVNEGRHLDKEEMVTSHKILHAEGLTVPHWPKEWGGADWTPVQHYIYTEELQFNGVPQPLPFNVSMCGPVIIAFGTEEQKKRFLPRMAALDDWWCQGFSEPGAGSDLAGLKTTAVRKGDHYVVNGQKTWTTLAQYADWIFCLCRTDPSAKKQLGISFLVFPMNSPGITVRPIVTMDGGREVNEVFFDDVKVPVENLIGQEHRGWDCAKFLLGNERTGIARVGYSKQRVQRIKELASRVMAGDRPLMEDERFREKVAAVEVDLKALEMTQMRVLSEERHRKGNTPNPASSILKIKGSEVQQATTALLLEVAGPLALPYQPDEDDVQFGSNEPPVGLDWAAPVAPGYFNYRKVSIYGGSNEIQRNIIAKAVLGF